MFQERAPRTSRPSRFNSLIRHLVIGAIGLSAFQSIVLHEQPTPAAAPVEAAEIAINEPASLPVAEPTYPVAVQPQIRTVETVTTKTVAAPVKTVGAPIWQGTAAREGNVRAAPHRRAAVLRELKAGEAVQVSRWVAGDEVEPDNTTWAEIGPGQFVFSMLLRSNKLAQAPARPSDAPTSGKWIDVNLTLQVATAYEGTTAVRTTLVSTGRPGWETPAGTSRVIRRVEKETMDGASLIGQGPDGKGASYKVENVRWTQYFTADGSAIHENSWRRAEAFGMPGSHGCIGMPSEEAAWFWSWAQVGTPLIVHP